MQNELFIHTDHVRFNRVSKQGNEQPWTGVRFYRENPEAGYLQLRTSTPKQKLWAGVVLTPDQMKQLAAALITTADELDRLASIRNGSRKVL